MQMLSMMMSFSRKESAITFQVLCIIGIAFSFVLTDNSLGDNSYNADTKLALEEMNRLFRNLFPIVPDKARYIWKSSHQGGSLTLQPPATTTGHHSWSEFQHSRILKPHLEYRTIEPILAENVLDAKDKADFVEIPPLQPMISPDHSNERTTYRVMSNKHVNQFQRKQPSPSEPAPLGKRGPECMRKCIAQGVLHPVQCHSLC